MGFTPTEEQRAIYNEFKHGKGHVVVIARAGVGKTTTAITGVRYAPEERVLFTCFNKRIAVEGNRVLGKLKISNAEFNTLHSLGLKAVRRYWGNVRINPSRRDTLTNVVCGDVPVEVAKLVTKLHCQAREILPHATVAEDLYDLAEQFECVPSLELDAEGFGLDYVCRKAVHAMGVAADIKPPDGVIDFHDMIFLPVRNKWMSKSYDMVVVDEAQDLTVAKLELAQGVCKGRMFVIGDDKQAIYGFCGADSSSLFRLEQELNAKVLHLTRTFRCGKAIVEEAKQFVPDFQAADSNHEGEIRDIPSEDLISQAEPGDFVLSRTNAPLVSMALKLLKADKRARIAGKDIGKGLIALVSKMRARSVPDFLKRVQAWADREQRRLKSRYAKNKEALEQRLEVVEDQSDILSTVAQGCQNVNAIVRRIEGLFTDDGLGDASVITCSSVHKAKGLEAERVFILAETLRGSTDEERNIQYVAITRAIRELVYVGRPNATAS